MFVYIQKKIKNTWDRLFKFVQENLVKLVIVGGLFVLLEVIQNFPYVNIIPSYQFLVIGFILFLIVILFREAFTNKRIIAFIILLFGISSIFAILDIRKISDLLGFVIFVLLILVTIRQIIFDRKKLREEID